MSPALATLRARLKQQRISQDKVAKEAGVHRTMVSHYLAGRWGSERVAAAAAKLLSHSKGRRTGKRREC